MIDLSDRFIGLMIGISLMLIFFGYIAFFTELEKPKHKKENQ